MLVLFSKESNKDWNCVVVKSLKCTGRVASHCFIFCAQSIKQYR